MTKDLGLDVSRLEGKGPFYVSERGVIHLSQCYCRGKERITDFQAGKHHFGKCCITTKTLDCIDRNDWDGFDALQKEFEKRWKGENTAVETKKGKQKSICPACGGTIEAWHSHCHFCKAKNSPPPYEKNASPIAHKNTAKDFTNSFAQSFWLVLIVSLFFFYLLLKANP